jgi:uncharacterized membrane protein YhhN
MSAPPILLCALAVAGLLWAERRDSLKGVWLAKPVASAAFVWAAVDAGALASSYGRLVLLALLLCMLGDVLLIPHDRKRVFRAGILAFLAGHVVFATAFASRPLEASGLWLGGALLAAVVWIVWRWLGPSLPADLAGAVRAYLVVIAIMATLACGVTAAGGPAAVAVGALAFAASDVSVARDRFVHRAFRNRAWGLPLYYGAQLLLASTVATATSS